MTTDFYNLLLTDCALAAVLLAPYLAWVCFATALSFSVWQRNPGLL